jgi:protein-S-isoprenylcysteine O-methyltransferase Ste14
MHGQSETSNIPRLTCTLIHLLFLALAAWVYFGGGGEVISGWLGLGSGSQGNSIRRLVLFGFGLILFLRISLTLFVLLRRRFDWSELWGVLLGLFCYQVVFALLGAGEARPLGVLDFVAIAIFILGSFLNTGSELQRKKFKDRPENKGMLYTRGLFRYARHINYFGDALWVTAWAMLTRNIWSFLIPLGLVAMFIFMFIPSLTKYLADRYGEQYELWAKKTKAFVPFIY